MSRFLNPVILVQRTIFLNLQELFPPSLRLWSLYSYTNGSLNNLAQGT